MKTSLAAPAAVTIVLLVALTQIPEVELGNTKTLFDAVGAIPMPGITKFAPSYAYQFVFEPQTVDEFPDHNKSPVANEIPDAVTTEAGVAVLIETVTLSLLEQPFNVTDNV
jgi:hypothetical protein